MRTEHGHVIIPRQQVVGFQRLRPALRGVYCTLYCWANWKDSEKSFGKEIIEIKKGSVWTTFEELCGHMRLGRSVLKAYLDILVEFGLISLKTHTYGTLITICQYVDNISSEFRDHKSNKRTREQKENKRGIRIAEAPAGLHPLFSIWNENCGSLSKALGMSKKRLGMAKLRWADKPDAEYWTNVIQAIVKSKFCRGENDRGWRATFDWLIKPDTHLNVMEGKYSIQGERPKPKRSQEEVMAQLRAMGHPGVLESDRMDKIRQEREEDERKRGAI